MTHVTFLSAVSFDRLEPVTIKDLDRKISALQRKVDDLADKILSVKQHCYWRGQDTDVKVADLSAELQEVKFLLVSSQGIWADCQRLADIEALHSRICTINKIQIQYIRFEKSINVIFGVDQSAFCGMHGTLSEMVDLLIQVSSPSSSIVQKVELLQGAFQGKHFDVASESPRDIGIELLHLFEMAFEKVISEIKETPDSEKYSNFLEKMLATIRKKITSFVRDSPRLSKDHPVYPGVEETAIQKLFCSITASKTKFSFWNMLSKISRVVSYVKAGQCESFGGKMEKELGTQISGMADKVYRKLVKIVEGKIAPENIERLTKKLDVYGNCYMQLKSNLKERRQQIYGLAPDATFKVLLNYAYGLRYELTEVGFLLDAVRELSTPQKLQLFKAKALLSVHARSSHRPITEAFALLEIGNCLKMAEPIQGEYTAFLKPLQLSTQTFFTKLIENLGTMAEDVALVWEILEKNEEVTKKHDAFFVKAVTRICFAPKLNQLDGELLLQVSVLKRDVAMQQRFQQNPLFASLLAQYDALCMKLGIVDLLDKSYHVLTLLLAAARSRPDVRLLANALQKYTEFDHEEFQNTSFHHALKNILKLKRCWLELGIEFRSLACVLYGTNAKEQQESHEYILSNYQGMRERSTADIQLLLFENTIAKIINNDERIAADEVEHLIEGPIKAFIINKTTDFDEMHILVVIDKLVAKERDMPADQQVVTQLVARYR